MIIVNTTFYVHETIVQTFMQWIRQEYIPSALSNGLTAPSVSRLLMESQEGMSGYAVQFMSEDAELAQAWHDDKAAALREILSIKYGEKILFFTTYMERLKL